MLLKLLALGGLGYAGYRYYEKNRVDRNGVAFADGQPEGQFRDAGAAATGTKGDTMSKTDEALDETYPASDATAKYCRDGLVPVADRRRGGWSDPAALFMRNQPDADRARATRRGLGANPLGVDLGDQRIDRLVAHPCGGGELFPEQRFEADRGAVSIDADRVLLGGMVGGHVHCARS